MNMGTGADEHVCSEIFGPIGENRPSKKKNFTADARALTLELRNKADAQPSTLVQLHEVYRISTKSSSAVGPSASSRG
jgi:hypothetical protein